MQKHSFTVSYDFEVHAVLFPFVWTTSFAGVQIAHF